MTATRQDIRVEQGSTFELVVEARKDGALLNITGYSGSMQVRPTKASATILATATVTLDTVNSLVIVTIPASTTGTYTWTDGYYDVKIDNGTTVYRIAEGYASLSKAVTHA